jgi:hypothetical protein
VFNRDRSRIVSQFDETGASGWDERHTVVTADGSRFTFDNAADVQKIYDQDGRLLSASAWGDAGPEAPKVQLAFLPLAAGAIAAPSAALAGRLAVQKAIEAGLVLFTWLSTRNGPDRTAFISFPSYRYARGKAEEGATSKEAPLVRVGQVTKERLGKVCPGYKYVQKYTDQAARDARLERNDWSPRQFGTEVHTRVAQEVNGRDRRPDDPQDPDFRAEFSLRKALAEDSKAKLPKPNPDGTYPRYAELGTIRIDVFEYLRNGRLCIYDIKTGNRVLLPGRMDEIVRSIIKHFPDTREIIITEVRPHVGNLR